MTTSAIIQTIIVLLILALALGWVLRRFWKLGKGDGCDCGCGKGKDCPHCKHTKDW